MRDVVRILISAFLSGILGFGLTYKQRHEQGKKLDLQNEILQKILDAVTPTKG